MGGDGVFGRGDARASGLSDRQIDLRLRSGELVAVRRGVLAHPGGDAHLLAVRAALTAHAGRDLVASHLTAARLLGLPKPLLGWRIPEFTAASGCTRQRHGIRVGVAALPPEEVVLTGDLPVTSPARTVLDCARTLPSRDGLAIADAALRRGLVTADELTRALERQSGWPRIRRARVVLMLADPARESPLESWSAWAFHLLRLPQPEWQVEIRDGTGTFVARVDCWWPGVAGEADGRSKYELGAAERGRGAAGLYEVLAAERRREQNVRAVGADLTRWAAADVLQVHLIRPLGDRLRAAIAQAQRRTHFTGRTSLPLRSA